MGRILELPSGRRFDAVGFGSNAVDNIIVVGSFPQYNSKSEFLSHQRLAGGEAASTMVGLSRLGWRTSYIGGFGDDDEGRLGLESLLSEGVDITHSRVFENARTQSAFIIVDEMTGERTVLWKRDASLNFPPNVVPLHLAAETAVLHLTPHDTEAAVLLADAARSAGTIVSIDIDSPVPGYENLLSLVDICIVSDQFPMLAFGETDPRVGLALIRKRFNCQVVGITLGTTGSLFFYENEYIETSAFPVPGGCADTTGAGDAFRAGFLHGVLLGMGIEGCARFANAVASLKCRSLGARTALPNAKEVQTMFKKD
jgi:sugar/nucleoside kinase (ribokinase family)